MQDGMKDWVEWHREYEDPSSSLSVRLACVRSHLAAALDEAPPGSLRLVSLCAGQGRDVLGVLPDHRRRPDVRAVLVETDPRNAEIARRAAAEAGLDQVWIREADAAVVASYADLLPADLLLLCGIFGNISDPDIERTIAAAPALCAPAATVIWTRHRRPPDLTPVIRDWFSLAGFDEVAFDAFDTPKLTGVGVHRLRGSSRPGTRPTEPLFSFQSAGQPGQ